MKSLLFILCFGFCLNQAQAQNFDEIEIKGVLLQQVQKWNEGNLEGFMEGYWKNDSLQFIGKNGITQGWQNTLNNYKKNYNDGMGVLAFTDLHFKRLSDQYYFVTGQWHLARNSGEVKGWYSLLFEKINGQWKIVADHSS